MRYNGSMLNETKLKAVSESGMERNMDVATKIGFFIGVSDDGKYLAATKAEPFFCIERDSQDEVIDAALSLWGLFLKTKGLGLKPQVTKRSDFTSHGTRFIPTQVILAEAC